MFTGLVGDLGRVLALERDGAGATLSLASTLAPELSPGDSIAVNGVCLTAVTVSDEGFSSQAMLHTLASSSLGALRPGSAVNLELALRADARLGGHVVQGHVDATGSITAVRQEGFSRVLGVRADPALLRYLVLKGSVALDGVSLTVSALADAEFCVSLIPETLSRTTLGDKRVGDVVNVEVDVLAKHVERLLGERWRAPSAPALAVSPDAGVPAPAAPDTIP